ncbi:tail fiber domain-containing protein [Thiothrix nivea]|uniref:Peptidase S74 domain-containing protein n=1 Tax=Thiothrix nivea (strain ATCC 35100 / DSM 5205 / JP2) TaxID=870187 RepID=A0A656HDT2_THINJ|nr:tail fiber domain-containing protein [Thiothrix nivea]EIJ34134.1 hypothetical protein Thini_1532 [Thiothrix nivea DSM 5205]
MNTKKLLLVATIQSILLLSATPVFAGDVEVTLPAATDAFTVDQPAGTELMRVNGAGNVGIGTATPSDGTANGGQSLKLDVEGAVGAKHYCDENGENCQTAASLASGNAGTAMAFKVTSTDTTTVQTRNEWWKMDAEWDTTAEINTFSNSTFANGAFTVGAGEGGLYEIFAKTNVAADEGRDQTTIHVNGLSVGSSSYIDGLSVVPSPAYALVNLVEGDTVEIYGHYNHSTTDARNNCSISSCYLTLQKIGAAATGGGAADNLGNHTATQNINLAANKLVGNGGTEGITIDATGNVGIGTTTPRNSLDISKDSGNTEVIVSTDDASESRLALLNSVRQWRLQNTASGGFSLFDSTANASRIYADTTGNVGIGTTSPTTDLQVADTDSSGYAHLQVGTGTTGGILEVAGSTGTATLAAKGGTRGEMELRDMGATADLQRSVIRNDDGKTYLANFTDTGTLVNYGMMFDHATGNVGIGTATPATKLHVNGSLEVDNGGGSILLKRNTAYTTVGHGNGIMSGVSPTDKMLGNIGFINTTTDPDDPQGSFFILTDTNNDGVSSNTERHLVVTQAGKVGIGTMTPTEKLHIIGGVKFEGLAAGSTGNYVCRTPDGTITHGGSCSTSDVRLKKDIQVVEGALDKVSQLQGVTYTWKDEARGTRTELGLIAQEVEKVIPEVVDTSNDEMGTKSIRYENLVALLIEGMKEQQQRIEALEKQLKQQ